MSWLLLLFACSRSPEKPPEPARPPPTEVATAELPAPIPLVTGPSAVAGIAAAPASGSAVSPEEAPATGNSGPANFPIPPPPPAASPPKPAPAAALPAPAAPIPPTAAAPEPPAPAAVAAPVAAKTYAISASNSTLYVQVFKDPDTAAAGLSHDHVMVARGWSGSVRWHPTDASQCQIDVSLPVRQLDVDPPSMREAVGYDNELTDSQRGDIRKHMLAEGQLNADAFPDITFHSTRCEGTTGTVNVTGTLTIRGKGKTITVPLKVDLDDGFAAVGTFKANHTDFGFQPFSAMMGALKNKDPMKFTIQLKAQ